MSITAAVPAAQAGTLGVGFSGAGFLIHFYLGVVDVLARQLGILDPSMPVAGASAGSIAMLTVTGVIPLDAMRKEAMRLSAYCRDHSNCYGILNQEFEAAARKLIPKDSFKKATIHGRTYAAVTYPSMSGPDVRLISDFKSNEDFIAAGAASCFIPFWAAPRLTTSFRGAQVYDGSLGGSGPGFLPCPPGVSYCLRVSSMPAHIKLGEFLINELALGSPENKMTLAQFMGKVAPQIPNNMADMASYYLSNIDKAVAVPGLTAKLVEALMGLVTPGDEGADIWPGRRHPLPASPLVYASWMIAPASPSENNAMFELGRKEALSWAEEAGFVKRDSSGRLQVINLGRPQPLHQVPHMQEQRGQQGRSNGPSHGQVSGQRPKAQGSSGGAPQKGGSNGKQQGQGDKGQPAKQQPWSKGGKPAGSKQQPSKGSNSKVKAAATSEEWSIGDILPLPF